MTLAGFLGLFALTTPRFSRELPVSAFFRLDPLAALEAVVASRVPLSLFGLALLMVVVALMAGRVWCGWLCPLGTLLELCPSPLQKRPRPGWFEAKYALLLATLIVAGGGLSLAAGIAPLALLVRFLDVVAGKCGTSLSAVVLLALPLVLILALNGLASRFWCWALCPLGALLGIASRLAPIRLRIGESCTGCGLCVALCPAGAITADGGRPSIAFSECILCLRCYESCPKGAVFLAWQWPPRLQVQYLPGRRAFLASMVGGIALLWLANSLSTVKRLRPPGATEGELFSRCIRCGECIKVCPTGALQPDGGSLKGLWTPVFVPRRGYCRYNCNACGVVCPTGAIPHLSLGEKQRVVMGRAVIDAGRCLAWAELRHCDVCYKTCPLPRKAVEMVEVEAVNEIGEKITVKCPQIIEELCTGCGVCEYNCPVSGAGAIRVLPL